MCSQPNRYAEVLRKLACSVKLWVDLKLLHIATYIKGNISGAFKCNIYLKSSKPTTLSKFIDDLTKRERLQHCPIHLNLAFSKVNPESISLMTSANKNIGSRCTLWLRF